MKKKLIALTLALIMIAFALISCGETPVDPTEQTTAAQADTTLPEATSAEDTLAPELLDTLPDEKKFNDEFVILSRKSTTYELESQEITGDIVTDAVTARNQAVEGRFGVTIKVVPLAGEWSDRDSFFSHVKNSVSSGKSEYDMISTHSAYIVNFGINGIAYNMNELDQIDFSKKWWSKFYAENVTINGKVYSALGDIDYTLYQYMMALFVNKKLAVDYNIGDIYAPVQDGSWTYERMMENVKKVYKDENGNGNVDQGDVFGLALAAHTARMAATAWDTKMTVKNSEGVQELNLPNEKYLDVYNTLYDCIYNNSNNVFFKDDINLIINEFVEERALYMSERVAASEKMKDMNSDYGIIPFPKYNAEQQRYISSSRDYTSAIAVPSNIDNPEMVGTVIEAMCMYGYQKITPQYYDVTLKFRYLSDPVAVDMLDIVRDSLVHDFGMTFTNYLDLMYSIMGDNIKNGVKDISRVLTSNTKAWKKDINAIYDAYSNQK